MPQQRRSQKTFDESQTLRGVVLALAIVESDAFFMLEKPYYPWFGVVAGLLGSIAINTGNNLQSLGMQQLEVELLEEQLKEGVDEELHLIKPGEHPEINPKDSTLWIIGTTVFVSGSLLNFASYSLAPQSLLASLESIQFVTNVIFGKLMLGKSVTSRMYMGTALTVSGTLLAIVFSPTKSAPINSVGDILDLWANPAWLGYLIFIGFLASSMQSSYNFYEKRKKEGRPLQNTENIMAILYSTYSALFGSTSVVFAKLIAEFLLLLGDGIPIFSHWYFYVNLVAWIVLMSYWLARLNNALALYDPLFIIPLLQANFICFAIVSGGIFYQEFNSMTVTQAVGFSAGIIVIFTGLYFLAPNDTSAGTESSPMVVESTKHGPLDDVADDDKIFGGGQHLNTILHKDSVGGSSKSAPDDDGNDDDEDHQSSVSNRSSSVSSLSSSWWGRKDSAGGRWSESREGGNEVQEAIADTFRALKVNLTTSTQQAREDAKIGKTHKRATHLFMSGAAHLNHAENMINMIRHRKEQELRRLMLRNPSMMTKEDTDKVRVLMKEIRQAEQSISLAAAFEDLMEVDGTISETNCGRAQSIVDEFRESITTAVRRRSISTLQQRRSSRISIGTNRDSENSGTAMNRPRFDSAPSSFYNLFNTFHLGSSGDSSTPNNVGHESSTIERCSSASDRYDSSKLNVENGSHDTNQKETRDSGDDKFTMIGALVASPLEEKELEWCAEKEETPGSSDQD